MTLVEAHGFLRFVGLAGIAAGVDVADDFFHEGGSAVAARSPFETLDVDFDAAVGFDGDLEFSLCHG